MRKFVILLGVTMVGGLPAVLARETAETVKCESLEEWTPDDVIGYLKVRDLGSHLEGLLASSFYKELRATDYGRAVESDEKLRKVLDELERFEGATGRKPLDFVKDLLGREVLAAARLRLSGPEYIFLTRADGEKGLQRAWKTLEGALADRLGTLSITEKQDYQGRTIERLGELAFTKIGEVVAFSNRTGVLEEVIDLAEGRSRRSLKSSEAFMKGVTGEKNAKLAYLAVRPRFIPDMEIPGQLDNPLGSLLAGGWAGVLGASELLTAGIEVGKDGVRLEIASRAGPDGLEKKYAPFFPEAVSSRLTSRLQKRGTLSILELHRDVHAWWENAEELLVPRAAGSLTQFAQVLGSVFGGRSFQDEVLPELGPTVTLVARNQSYKGLGSRPQPAIPGFAALFQLKDAKRFGRDLEAAFQSLIGIININQAQQKKDGKMMLVRSEKVGKTNLVTVDLGVDAEATEQLGIEYNFTPSLAIVGDRLVLSSSEELARILVEELDGKTPAQAAAASKLRDRLVIDASQVGSILEHNLEVLAANSMMKKGIGLEEARGELRELLELLKYFRDARLESWLEGETFRVKVRVRMAGSKSADKARI